MIDAIDACKITFIPSDDVKVLIPGMLLHLDNVVYRVMDRSSNDGNSNTAECYRCAFQLGLTRCSLTKYSIYCAAGFVRREEIAE